nr:sulfotransferase [Actinopolymorpha pittospori]
MTPRLRATVKQQLSGHPRLLREVRRVRRAARRPARWRAARRRIAADARSVRSPVFVICPVRSGSTLLRVLLNSHPDICAPHELHLRFVRVAFERHYAELSMKELGLDQDELEYVLWDRIMHRELVASGKRVLIDKTPGNATFHERLVAGWPDARFIFLLRHPASIVASLMETRPDRELTSTIREALTYLEGVEEARKSVPGLVVRYEDLVADPATVTRQVCQYVSVRWDPRMLEYGRSQHGTFRAGIGDWTLKIRSGRVQPGRELPDPADVPEQLRPIARAWGYLD